MLSLSKNVVVFYLGRPHKFLEYVQPERKKGKFKARLLSLWRESEEEIFIKGEHGVTRVAELEDLEVPPEGVAEEQEHYLALLRQPALLKALVEETSSRVEGEWATRYSLILTLGSLWLEGEKNLLHTLVNSVSSAGKGHVTKAVFDLLPKHLGVYRTKITPTTLTYWHAKDDNWTWDNKLLFLDDVSQALLDSDVFKVMLTEGSIATVTKDQEAVDIHIQGKPLLFLTTAHGEVKDETTNRLLFLSLNETVDQTKAIMQRQAAVASGALAEKEYCFELRNALALLKRVKVVVPFAEKLPQYFPSSQISIRRDFPRFLCLVKASAALHQYNRSLDDQGRVVATLTDYELARQAFLNYSFDAEGVKMTGTKEKAAKFVQDLLERGLHLDDDGQAYITVKDAQTSTLYSSGAWYATLDDLAEKKLLRKANIDGQGNKPLSIYYKGRSSSAFNLPTVREIEEAVK